MENSVSTAEIETLPLDPPERCSLTNDSTSAFINTTNGGINSLDDSFLNETQNLTLFDQSNHKEKSAISQYDLNQITEKPLNITDKEGQSGKVKKYNQTSDCDHTETENLLNGYAKINDNLTTFSPEIPLRDQPEIRQEHGGICPNPESLSTEIPFNEELSNNNCLIIKSESDHELHVPDDRQADKSSVSGDDECQKEHKSLSHYKRPENKPLPPQMLPADEDLSFGSMSASQAYENFIKDAYSKALKQVEQSRAMIEAHTVQQIGQLNRELEFIQNRPIRTFGRHNDTTHENGHVDDDSRAYRRALHSVDSPPLSSDVTGDGASSSSSFNDTDDPPCSATNGTEDRASSSNYLPTCETNSLYGNRRYYSKFSRDPDYFDFDLRHSVDLFRKPNMAASNVIAPARPTVWEHRLFKDKSRLHGDCTISPHLFDADSNKSGLKKTGALETSFISSALRTPSYWEYRYQHMNGPLNK